MQISEACWRPARVAENTLASMVHQIDKCHYSAPKLIASRVDQNDIGGHAFLRTPARAGSPEGAGKQSPSSLVVIKGRRRIGKSRLTDEFARQMPRAMQP